MVFAKMQRVPFLDSLNRVNVFFAQLQHENSTTVYSIVLVQAYLTPKPYSHYSGS